MILNHSLVANGGDISWNQVIDTPGSSSVEDVINIFLSHGQSEENPIRIHDNYIQGVLSAAETDDDYTGDGITTDGASNDLRTATGFVDIYNNQVVHTANAGIGIAAGHDIIVTGNNIVSCGKDTNGQWIATTSAQATFMWNAYNSNVFFNNSISGTSGGLVRPNSSNNPEIEDLWSPDASTSANNVIGTNFFTDPCMSGGDVSLGPELAVYGQWLNKLTSESQTIGAGQ